MPSLTWIIYAVMLAVFALSSVTRAESATQSQVCPSPSDAPEQNCRIWVPETSEVTYQPIEDPAYSSWLDRMFPSDSPKKAHAEGAILGSTVPGRHLMFGNLPRGPQE